MFNDLKNLVVVMAIALAVFAVARPVCERYMEGADFRRRRNVWLTLTVLAFVTPSIWLYAAVAMPLMFLAAKRDPNPLALYALLMFLIPNVSAPLPSIGFNQLFALNHVRMLSLAILVPVVWRRQGQLPGAARFGTLDWILLAYCVLQLALFTPYEAFTNTMRRSFLLFLDTFVVFYAFARLRPTRAVMTEVAVMFCLVCGLLAPLAIFESVRGWLLYEPIPYHWGIPTVSAWLLRGDALRAQVSTGHSLSLGYTISLGIGFLMFVQSQRARSTIDTGITLILCTGLIVSYSRGAWLTALILFIVYMAVRPGSASVFVKVLPVIALLTVVAYFSPLKEIIIDRLPIIGTSDQDTVEYRRRLAEVSWQLIKLNPLLGDPFVTNNMEELRQGQGIIDIVNAYLSVTLFYGFAGLSLFLSFFLVALWRCYRALKSLGDAPSDTAALGAALVACMVATLFFIATAGVGSIQFFLTGLMASYAGLAMKVAPSRDSRFAHLSVGQTAR